MRNFPTAKSLFAVAALSTITMFSVACGSPGPTTEFSQTYVAAAGASLVIDNGNGSTVVAADVSASATGEVLVEATLEGSDRIEFNVTESSDEIRITADTDSGGLFKQSPRANIRVTVPVGMAVDVSSGNGRVEISGAEAAARVSTGNGSITIESAHGAVSANSGNGSITVIDSVGSFRLTSGNGGIDVQLNGALDVAIDAETDNGSVGSSLVMTSTQTITRKRIVGQIGEGSASLRARSGNGSIDLSSQ